MRKKIDHIDDFSTLLNGILMKKEMEKWKIRRQMVLLVFKRLFSGKLWNIMTLWQYAHYAM